MDYKDTIAAVSTAQRRAGIAVVRLSGTRVSDIISHAFKPFGGITPRKAVRGEIIADGKRIDDGLLLLFTAPNSYTGEDLAEFHCHGSPAVVAALLRELFRLGARQAERGEFTKRAFLNGKLDLIRAEAVIDVIDAPTEQAAANAATQLLGGLSGKINAIYDALTSTTAHFYAAVDYPDEDIEPQTAADILSIVTDAHAKLCKIAATFERGRVVKNGLLTVLLGKPNAGKSSLMNAVVGFERAIVTDIPGTTRDTVEESAMFGGMLLRLTDTAGLRQLDNDAAQETNLNFFGAKTEKLNTFSQNPSTFSTKLNTRNSNSHYANANLNAQDVHAKIEQLGIQRSLAALNRADLLIVVLDASAPLSDEDRAVLSLAQQSAKPTVIVLNKSDLPNQCDYDALPVSAVTGDGLDNLADAIAELFAETHRDSTECDTLLSNERQFAAISDAVESLKLAADSIADGIPPEVTLAQIESALFSIGEVTGKTVRDDIVTELFSRFCVGK